MFNYCGVAALRQSLCTLQGAALRSVIIELLPTDYETLRRSSDDLRYGQLSSYPLVGLGSLSEFDQSRVPSGRAIVHAWDYVPYQRADGRSQDRRAPRQSRAPRCGARQAGLPSGGCSRGIAGGVASPGTMPPRMQAGGAVAAHLGKPPGRRPWKLAWLPVSRRHAKVRFI